MVIPTIGMLHTSPIHVRTFERLAKELVEPVKLVHRIEEKLLPVAVEEGVSSALVIREVKRLTEKLFNDGADVVVCTCSTLGGIAEQQHGPDGTPVQRIDRAMADQAVGYGNSILIAAVLGSTLEPTRQLVLSSAYRAAKEVDLHFHLVDDAWSLFLCGDTDAYLATIAASVAPHVEDKDVVILAQASMDGAVEALSHLGVPVLSSPMAGLQHAVNTALRLGGARTTH